MNCSLVLEIVERVLRRRKTCKVNRMPPSGSGGFGHRVIGEQLGSVASSDSDTAYFGHGG